MKRVALWWFEFHVEMARALERQMSATKRLHMLKLDCGFQISTEVVRGGLGWKLPRKLRGENVEATFGQSRHLIGR